MDRRFAAGDTRFHGCRHKCIGKCQIFCYPAIKEHLIRTGRENVILVGFDA